MCKSAGVFLLALWAFSACPISVAAAVGDAPPPQVPSHTPSGANNLTDVWLHNGGGRLYWNTLVTPRQVALEGARFNDPAAVPELVLNPPADKKPPVRHASSKPKSSKSPKAAAQATPSPAPKGAGKTSLQAPVSQGSAIPPLGSTPAAPASVSAPAPAPASAPASAPPSAPAASPAKPSSAAPAPASGGMPYSTVAPSPVGGIGGDASGTAGAGMASAAPAPSAFSADDVLPRANARP